MTNDEIVRALRECANSLRRVATRRTVVADDENDLRLVASSLDHVALEFATAAKSSKPRGLPFGEEGPR
jgi:hypothetical protein